jgi:hypothetical protein
VHPVIEACFFLLQAQIKLGAPVEVASESSSKRPRGRLANIGHFHEEAGLENFIPVIFNPTLGMLQIPSKFVVDSDPSLKRSQSSPTPGVARG